MKGPKNIFLFLLFATIYYSGFSQSIKFRKVIGNSGYDVGMSAKQTIDSGYIVLGSTTSFGSGTSDFYLLKTDSLGTPKWQQMYGGVNIDKGTCVRQTIDKGYILTGYTNSYGAGGYDVYLVKTDSFGAVQWTHTYGGTDWDFANCVEQTNDGGYIICGGTYSYGKGDEDYYLIKTDALGDTLWTKTYGGVKGDEAKSVIQTSDGGYILTGTTKSMGDVNGDFYTVKTTANGDTLWTNKFGGPLLDYGNDVIENSFGGYTIGGETKNFGGGNSDGILIYIYSGGNIDPTVFTTGGANNETIESISENQYGKLFITGRTFTWGYTNGNGDLHAFLLNSTSWSFINSTTFGTVETEFVNSIECTNDKGAIICGTTNGYNNKLDDIYLIKTDSTVLSTTFESIFITTIQTLNTSDVYSFAIAPNPSNVGTYLHIKTNSEKINVSVYNIIGELLSREEFSNASHNLSIPINTSDLPNGIYLLKVETDSSVHTEKIIVRH